MKDNKYVYFQAPELRNMQMYNSKIDVWSASVVIYILITGDMPNYDVENFNKNQFKLTKINKVARDFLR